MMIIIFTGVSYNETSKVKARFPERNKSIGDSRSRGSSLDQLLEERRKAKTDIDKTNDSH